MTKYRIRGKYNEISESAVIGDNSILSSFDFIGKNAIIGKNVHIANYVEINNDCKIGDNTSIQVFTVFNSNTVVGKNCLIAGHVGTTDEKYPTPFTKTIKRTPCQIEDNVILGEGAKLICCKIGNNSVIGTGSVVTKDIPENQVWVGNPAKFLMTRKEYDQKQKEFLIDQNC